MFFSGKQSNSYNPSQLPRPLYLAWLIPSPTLSLKSRGISREETTSAAVAISAPKTDWLLLSTVTSFEPTWRPFLHSGVFEFFPPVSAGNDGVRQHREQGLLRERFKLCSRGGGYPRRSRKTRVSHWKWPALSPSHETAISGGFPVNLGCLSAARDALLSSLALNPHVALLLSGLPK